MAGFRLLFTELCRETQALSNIARCFLDPGRVWVLDRFLSHLQSIAGTPGEHIRTLELQCLRTKPSKEYEGGSRRGGQDVHAAITGIWDLRPLGSSSKPKREVEFCGKASTRIELYGSDDGYLGMWRLELGAEDSPGCYIHAQILGDSDKPPFPKSVPIPRLPSIFVTPMSAVEFVLGELFQDKWAKVTARNTGDVTHWRAYQQKQLQCLFSWYQALLKQSNSSPWMALKEAKPKGLSL